MRKIIILFIIILALLTTSYFFQDKSEMIRRFWSGEDSWLCVDNQWVQHGYPRSSPPVTGCGEVNNFFDCLKNSYPVMESYPRKCRVGEETFIENIGNELEKMDLIKINNPRPNQVIKNPLVIEGEAKGNWFFEGDFPIVLTNWDGLIIAEGYATAQSNWMTDTFVKFKAEIEFEKDGVYNRGTLILRKDNPSGLPENDDALEIPIFFE